MDFRIDTPYDLDAIRQFASQLDKVDPTIAQGLGAFFEGDRSMDFYHGMIAGLAASYAVLENQKVAPHRDAARNLVGAMLAHTASHFAERIG